MTTIITKNSSTAGAAPTASDLVQGELAVNVTDKALYTENASGTVVKLNAPSIVDNGNATAITIDSSENVGIGASSPASKLDVAGDVSISSSESYLYLYSNYTIGNNSRVRIRAVGAGGGSGYGGDLRISTRAPNNTWNTDALTLDSSGNLLVGTTSSAKGSTGSIISVGVAQENFRLNGSGTQTFITFNLAGTTVGSITAAGSTTSYVTSSDYRLKENIEPMTGALETVAQLKPCTYSWKIDGTSGQGFIAHELEEVCPDAVVGEKDAVDEDGNPKYQGIDTSFLVATLTAAIQEQQALITSLTTRIEALEAK